MCQEWSISWDNPWGRREGLKVGKGTFKQHLKGQCVHTQDILIISGKHYKVTEGWSDLSFTSLPCTYSGEETGVENSFEEVIKL